MTTAVPYLTMKSKKQRRDECLRFIAILNIFMTRQKKRRLHEITTNLSSAVVLHCNSREYVQPVHPKTVSPQSDSFLPC